jgi:hypothetical protein
MLTQEQQLARLLVVAIHRLGGSLEVDHSLLDHMGHYNIVWAPTEDLVGVKVTLRSGEILIAHVDGDTVDVVL